MTLGMFGARADHRGLATLTALMWRHLQPAKTVVVNMGKHSQTAFHPDEYGDAPTITYDDALQGTFDLEAWLDGLDTVLTFEIPYDPRLYDVCRDRGVRTVELCMPELDGRQRNLALPRPDVIALPTTWLAERYPDSPILPVPAEPISTTPGGLVVHPSSLAMRDRNGTQTVLAASKFTSHPVVVRGQAPPDKPWWRATVETGDLPESADLYAGAGLAVIPRRYGGLSLTIQEAMSAGLPVLIPESDPYAAVVPREARLRAVEGRWLQAKGGQVGTWDCEPREVAERIDLIMGDDELRQHLADASVRWCEANRWERVRGAWDAVLSTKAVVG